MAIVIMLNNLFHDFAVALLGATYVMMWLAARPAAEVSPRGLAYLAGRLGRVATACWIWILVGGAVRTWAYEEYEWLPAAGRGQVAALVVKHAVLVGLIGFGVAAHVKLKRMVRP